MGNTPQRTESITKAMELNPDPSNPSYDIRYYSRGGYYEKVGKYREALKDYEKCLEIRPNDSELKECRERVLKLLNTEG